MPPVAEHGGGGGGDEDIGGKEWRDGPEQTRNGESGVIVIREGKGSRNKMMCEVYVYVYVHVYICMHV